MNKKKTLRVLLLAIALAVATGGVMAVSYFNFPHNSPNSRREIAEGMPEQFPGNPVEDNKCDVELTVLAAVAEPTEAPEPTEVPRACNCLHASLAVTRAGGSVIYNGNESIEHIAAGTNFSVEVFGRETWGWGESETSFDGARAVLSYKKAGEDWLNVSAIDWCLFSEISEGDFCRTTMFPILVTSDDLRGRIMVPGTWPAEIADLTEDVQIKVQAEVHKTECGDDYISPECWVGGEE